MQSYNNQHLFSQVPTVDIPRSTFDRSFKYMTTFDSGYLVPFMVDEVLPGDTFNCKVNLFARLATPIVPIMDNMHIETFFFYVPNRLLWEHWDNMLGEQENPGDSIDYLVPMVEATNQQSGSLWDYFGLPTYVSNALKASCLPFRAYNLIWSEWFRDENLQDRPVLTKADSDTLDNYKLLKRGKRMDYFSGCLPWPQRGEPISIGLTGTVPVYGDGKTLGLTNGTTNYGMGYAPGGSLGLGMATASFGTNAGSTFVSEDISTFNVGVTTDASNSGLIANVGAAASISVNDLRLAFQVQKLQEQLARSGSRLKEILLGAFGVLSPDARLQRPEYLGGSSARLIIKPVEQNSASNETTPQGNLAAYGVVGDSFHGFTKSFVEHGIIIGLVNVRADLSYQQGINRMWSREDRLDYYWPVLAHLGEQAVLNKEIYADGTDADEEAFGYQERWAEYRYKPSLITGKFRSSDPQSLDIWHLAQDFETRPHLNAEFIEDNPPVDRVIAVPSEPQFLFDSFVELECTRPMPVYSVPGLVDHF